METDRSSDERNQRRAHTDAISESAHTIGKAVRGASAVAIRLITQSHFLFNL